MSLVDWAVIIMGSWTMAMIVTGLVLALRSGAGELAYDTPQAGPLVLRQAAGVMPRRAWGFRPAVHHSRYDPAPWQLQAPRADEHSADIVERATDIKRELGSEHPPWERLDRQGL